MRMKTLVSALATAGCLLAIVAPAAAREASRGVRYADLDLSKPAHVDILRTRVARAVEAVCGSYASAESWQYPEIDHCRDKAQDQASILFARAVSAAEARRLASR